MIFGRRVCRRVNRELHFVRGPRDGCELPLLREQRIRRLHLVVQAHRLPRRDAEDRRDLVRGERPLRVLADPPQPQRTQPAHRRRHRLAAYHRSQELVLGRKLDRLEQLCTAGVVRQPVDAQHFVDGLIEVAERFERA